MKNPVVIPTYPPNYEYPPSDYRNIHGRPSVTVSPRGLTLGTSEYFNDGADFGPDTPGTSTCGIQEAVTHAQKTGAAVSLMAGTYIISETITISSGSGAVAIYGVPVSLFFTSQTSATQVRGTRIFPAASFAGSVLFNLENSEDAVSVSGLGLFGLPASSCQALGSSGTAPTGMLDGLYVRSGTGCVSNMLFWNCDNAYKFTGGVNYGTTDHHGFQIVNCNVGISNAGTGNAFQAIVTFNNYTNGVSINDLSVDEAIYDDLYLYDGYVGISVQTPSGSVSKIYVTNCHYEGNGLRFLSMDQAGQAEVFVSGVTTYAQMLAYLNGSGVSKIFISQGYALDGGYGGSAIVRMASGATNSGYLRLRDFDLGAASNLSPGTVPSGFSVFMLDCPGYNPQGFSATTPSIPSSGTAQENTNPYSVRVYILTGGTATGYTITDPSGTTQAISVTLAAGMEITLDPGASITLTYTVAPTWKWYGV